MHLMIISRHENAESFPSRFSYLCILHDVEYLKGKEVPEHHKIDSSCHAGFPWSTVIDCEKNAAAAGRWSVTCSVSKVYAR